jgi:hypothetical protein
MSETDQVRLSISKAEYYALSDLRGLEQSVQYMVIQAEKSATGRYILEGSEATFDSLQSDLSDEIFYELSPKTRLMQLRRLYRRLSPGSIDLD